MRSRNEVHRKTRTGAAEAETEVKEFLKRQEGLDNDGIPFQMESINLSFPTVHQPQVLRSRS